MGHTDVSLHEVCTRYARLTGVRLLPDRGVERTVGQGADQFQAHQGADCRGDQGEGAGLGPVGW